MTDVTATVVLYNSADHLADCLESLRPDVTSGRVDIVAVNNASPDDSVQILAREAPAAQIVEAGDNLGFAGGCNRAWPYVSGRYWLLLNPDATLEDSALARLVEYMDRNPRVAATSPWLREVPSGALRFPGRAFPSAFRTLLEVLRLHRLLPEGVRGRLLQGSYVKPGSGPSPDPDWIPGTAMLVRVAAVQEVGLLDEQFFLYGEDLEWCWRMRRADWSIAVVDDAVATHRGRTSGERTWSGASVEERMAAGMVAAYRQMHGRRRARTAAFTVAATYALEAAHPRRTPEQRATAADVRRAWWRAFRRA